MDEIVLNDLAASNLKFWLGALIVALLGISAVEGIVMSHRAPEGYDWRAFAVSIADAVGRRLTEAVSSSLGLMLAIPLISWVYEHRLFTIGAESWWALALLFVGNEFCYYWYHRSGHRVRWFNTPSNHRVHHGSNPEYLDCNYGGVLMIFDRLFGTYVEERADLPQRYGLATPLLTYNPLRIAFHEWINLARDLRDARSALDICRALFSPPGARKSATRREATS